MSYFVKKLMGRLDPAFFEKKLADQLLRHAFKDVTHLPAYADREAVWDQVLGDVRDDNSLTVLEFGVHRGESVRRLMAMLPRPGVRFHGFDSFVGLPEDWNEVPAAHFSTDGQIPATDDSRVVFHKGWFNDTLPPFLETFDAGRGPVFVHFDADVYGSTLFVLTQLWNRLGSYRFCFDEFAGHEARALYSFTQAYPVSVTFRARNAGGRIAQVSGIMGPAEG